MSQRASLLGTPKVPLGAPAGSRRAPRAVPAPTSLAVVGVSSFNSSATAAAYSASLNPPANADGALVLFVTRSNGAGPAYAPALTWAGLPATLLSENSAGVGDFGVITGAFLARGGFVLGDAVDRAG